MEDDKLPETENTSNENKEAIPTQNPESTSTTETEQQINWRKFREAREKERKEKQEAERKEEKKEAEVQALKAAMEALVNKPASSHETELQYVNDTEEQRIAKLVEQSLERERKKLQAQEYEKEKIEFPQRLNRDFQDFNQVCTSENLDYLEYHYPEVAEAYKHMPDGYNKWASVYKAVKRFVPSTNPKQNQALAEKNLSKPQSMSIPGKTSTGDSAPQYLDDKRKTDNWQRMLRTMRGGS